MTYKDKYKQNQKLIRLYNDYLVATALSYEDRLKIIAEMGRLHRQNQQIEQMPVANYYQETHDYQISI